MVAEVTGTRLSPAPRAERQRSVRSLPVVRPCFAPTTFSTDLSSLSRSRSPDPLSSTSSSITAAKYLSLQRRTYGETTHLLLESTGLVRASRFRNSSTHLGTGRRTHPLRKPASRVLVRDIYRSSAFSPAFVPLPLVLRMRKAMHAYLARTSVRLHVGSSSTFCFAMPRQADCACTSSPCCANMLFP